MTFPFSKTDPLKNNTDGDALYDRVEILNIHSYPYDPDLWIEVDSINR